MNEQMIDDASMSKEDDEFVALIAKYIKILKERTGLSNEAIAKGSGVSLSTVKNICAMIGNNPGFCTVRRVIYSMGGTFEEMHGFEKTKEDLKGISIHALKEMYEFQAAERNKASEKHIDEIRAHYAQHREDVTNNYEHLLSNKRELIDSYKEHLMSVQKENKWLKFACGCMFVAFAGLCVAELMNPNIGWIRF